MKTRYKQDTYVAQLTDSRGKRKTPSLVTVLPSVLFMTPSSDLLIKGNGSNFASLPFPLPFLF